MLRSDSMIQNVEYEMGVSLGEMSYSCSKMFKGLAQKFPEFRNSGLLEFRITGIPDFWNSGIPELLNSGIPDFPEIWNSGIPEFRISGIPEFRNF